MANKAGVCRCGHEIDYWHDPETGRCMHGRAWKGHAASTTGACDCVRKVKTVKKKERVLEEDEVALAFDHIISGFERLRSALTAKKTRMVLDPVVATKAKVVDLRLDPLPKTTNGEVRHAKMKRKLLTALAQHPNGLTKKQVLLHAAYRDTGSSSEAFADMAREHWIAENLAFSPSVLYITDAGRAWLGHFEKLPTGSKLLAHLLNGSKLKTMDKNLLRVIASRKDTWKKEDVLDLTEYSDSGSVSESFARLSEWGYVVRVTSGFVRASEILFD